MIDFPDVPLIATITNDTFELPCSGRTEQFRLAARVLVVDDKGCIPVLYTALHGHHKIPGGGVEINENPSLAAIREAHEEAGAIIEINNVPIAKILEIKSDQNTKQLSLLFIGTLIEKNKSTDFTTDEIREGYKGAVWMSVQGALELFSKDRPKTYMGKFMHARDFEFLKYAHKIGAI